MRVDPKRHTMIACLPSGHMVVFARTDDPDAFMGHAVWVANPDHGWHRQNGALYVSDLRRLYDVAEADLPAVCAAWEMVRCSG